MRPWKLNTTFKKRAETSQFVFSSGRNINYNGLPSAAVRIPFPAKPLPANDAGDGRPDWPSPRWTGRAVCGVGSPSRPAGGRCLPRRPFGFYPYRFGKCFHLAVLPGSTLSDLLKYLRTFFTLMDSFLFTVSDPRCRGASPDSTFCRDPITTHFVAHHSTVSLYAFHLVFHTQLVSTHCPTCSSLRIPTSGFPTVLNSVDLWSTSLSRLLALPTHSTLHIPTSRFLTLLNFRVHLKNYSESCVSFPHLSLDIADREGR